ncbi:hypothetical protein BU15DRAFT_59248 [Melanogaster broomeanus]|nr:hypothetical protein BU15DRAFT_59248 [Melanogaster broomeanus]
MSIPSPQSHNEVQLSRAMLLDLLNDLQSRTLQLFGCQIRLFVHGGAVMILHDQLSTSSTRQDDKRCRLHQTIQRRLNIIVRYISTDWMNADPDVALPFARESVDTASSREAPILTAWRHTAPKVTLYDPIYFDSKQPNNVKMNTIYSSPGLNLISVTMFWGVALKLVRYKKEDPADIVAMLRHGTKLNGVKWTPLVMEGWLKTLCWPMGYNNYQPQRIEELQSRIQDAIRLLQNSPDDFVPGSGSHPHSRMRRNSMHSVRDAFVGHGHSHADIHMQIPPHVQSHPYAKPTPYAGSSQLPCPEPRYSPPEYPFPRPRPLPEPKWVLPYARTVDGLTPHDAASTSPSSSVLNALGSLLWKSNH